MLTVDNFGNNFTIFHFHFQISLSILLMSWWLMYLALLDFLLVPFVNYYYQYEQFPKQRPRLYEIIICFLETWLDRLFRSVVPPRAFTFPGPRVLACQRVEESTLPAILLWTDTLQYITSISHPSPRRQPPPLATRPPSPTQQRESAYLGEKDREDIKSVSIIF